MGERLDEQDVGVGVSRVADEVEGGDGTCREGLIHRVENLVTKNEMFFKGSFFLIFYLPVC